MDVKIPNGSPQMPQMPQMPPIPPQMQPQMTFPEAIKTCFNKYIVFSGRASRSEYWWWELFNVIVGIALCWSDWLTYIAGALLFFPGLCVACRRLHDIGKGAGWIFLAFVPLIGPILLIIWYIRPSEPYPNRFGPVPQ